MAGKRGFGSIRKLPSKRYQARYMGPDGNRHQATVTFTNKADAEGWLARERDRVERGQWESPWEREKRFAANASDGDGSQEGPVTVSQFISAWLPSLELRPTTRRDYESLLRNHIQPRIGDIVLQDLSKRHLRTWWEALDPTKPRARSKAFQFLHTALNGAVELDLLPSNPAVLPRRTRIRTKTARKIYPLSVVELEALADEMPAHLRLSVLIGGWCGLRYGELAELRRRDVDAKEGTIRVQRAVIKVPGGYEVGPPKTDAGERTVHMPLSLLSDLRHHLNEYALSGPDGLLIHAPDGRHLHSSVFARAFAKAARGVGRPDATPHVLRHTQASLAADISAPTPVTMRRLGHTTVGMTMRYTHALADADKQLAAALDRVRDQHLRIDDQQAIGGKGKVSTSLERDS